MPVTNGNTSFAPDFGAGIDFIWTLTGTGCTLATPTNIKAGQKGIIYIVQNASGNCTITTWASHYKFSGGLKPTLSTAANAVDVLSYAVKSTSEVECFFTPSMS